MSEDTLKKLAVAAVLALVAATIEARVQIAVLTDKVSIAEDVKKNTEFRIAWNAKWPDYGEELRELAGGESGD